MNANTLQIIDEAGYSQDAGIGIWKRLLSPVYLIVDEQGNNPNQAEIRHLLGASWLCRDNEDGYRILDQDAVEHLILVEKYPAAVQPN